MNTLFSLNFPRTAAAVAAFLLCAACSFSPEGFFGIETVRIELPAYPDGGASGQSLPQLAGWLVVTQDGGLPEERFVSPSSRFVVFEFPKNEIAPVLCYPLVVAEGGADIVRFFYPAGCVYPVSRAADWKHGFDALLAFDLLAGGAANSRGENSIRARVSSFNWKRLHDEIAGVSNPWNIDMTRCKTAIASHSFTKNIITKNPNIDSRGVADAPPRLYGQYVPDAASFSGDAGTYDYCPGRENLAFDGTDVFLVQMPSGSPGTVAPPDTPYTLAPMPSSRYIYRK